MIEQLKNLIAEWREYANGSYCQTYNKEMAKGLLRAAEDLEKLIISEQPLTKNDVYTLIDNNSDYVVKALIYLHSQQTEEEKVIGSATTNNGAGFNKVDSSFGTSLAISAQAHGYLTEGQLHYARKMLHKYAGQLLKAGIDVS